MFITQVIRRSATYHWAMKFKGEKLKQRVTHALSACGRGTAYGLGQGGMDPLDPLPTRTGRCDCSGFVAWAIGISRWQANKLKPWSRQIPWIETTAIYKDATGPKRLFCQIPHPVPGAVVVYPDRIVLGRKRQGHTGIVTAVRDSRSFDVAHCSVGNDRKGDAAQNTPGDVFQNGRSIFCVLLEDIEAE